MLPTHPARSDEADDLRVRRFPGRAGANRPVVGHRRQVRLPRVRNALTGGAAGPLGARLIVTTLAGSDMPGQVIHDGRLNGSQERLLVIAPTFRYW